MFCRCELEYGAAENTRTCPVCLAHPGALPVPNERAIEHTIKLGLALGCEISRARDLRAEELLLPRPAEGLPDQPVRSPALRPRRARRSDRRTATSVVGIVRAHLEEDAAKTVHAGGATGRSVGADYWLVDFNRGGTPLLEIVSEPDLRSADEADRFLRLLRQTIVELGVSDAEMEKGTMRADVNVSVRKRGEEGYRPRWELKNMNSLHLHPPCHRGRGARADRSLRARRDDRAVDVRLRPRHRSAHRAPLEGGGGRLSLLPRAGPRARRAAGGARRASPRRAAGAARRAHRAPRAGRRLRARVRAGDDVSRRALRTSPRGDGGRASSRMRS